jgi:Polysaccharide lyase family 4, domain II
VLNGEQQAAPGATVVLVPEPKLRDRQDAYKTATSDQNGRFSLKNIGPGDYKLFAWEDIEPGIYMDADFLRPVEDRGHSIGIHEGSRETVHIGLIP